SEAPASPHTSPAGHTAAPGSEAGSNPRPAAAPTPAKAFPSSPPHSAETGSSETSPAMRAQDSAHVPYRPPPAPAPPSLQHTADRPCSPGTTPPTPSTHPPHRGPAPASPLAAL